VSGRGETRRLARSKEYVVRSRERERGRRTVGRNAEGKRIHPVEYFEFPRLYHF